MIARTCGCHAFPLPEEELKVFKASLEAPESFFIPEDVYAFCKQAVVKKQKYYEDWKTLVETTKKTSPDKIKLLKSYMVGKPANYEKLIKELLAEPDLAGRDISHLVLNKLAPSLLEKQFHGYYEKADRMKGKTGEIMLSLLERRLDNVVYRLGLGASRAMARQIVNHTHILVNGKKVNIPSYQVKVGDVISVKEKSASSELFAAVKGARVIVPKWLEFDATKLTGKVIALPARDDIDLTIAENRIIELYSK